MVSVRGRDICALYCSTVHKHCKGRGLHPSFRVPGLCNVKISKNGRFWKEKGREKKKEGYNTRGINCRKLGSILRIPQRQVCVAIESVEART